MQPHSPVSSNILEPILQAGPLARFVLGILLFFSVICWALIVEKWWEFRAIKRDSKGFMRAFREGRRFSLIYGAAKKFRASTLAQLYAAAGLELVTVYGGADQVDAAIEDGEGLPREMLDSANRAMRRAGEIEATRMERYLPFLATTASAAPFIGLFGTIVGIMSSFQDIGRQGSASLAVVAPGIGEALIATAAGLGAAIPAVMGYNFFINRARRLATDMDNFALELLNIFARPAPAKVASR